MGDNPRPDLDTREEITNRLGEDLPLCYQCGGCTGVCPWGEVGGGLNPRVIMRRGQLGIGNILSDEIWLCTTCDECVDQCPHQVNLPSVMSSIRSLSVEKAMIPGDLQDALESMFRLGNPWSGSVRKRVEWTKDIEVPDYEDQDMLWWVCCTLSYDDRNRNVARAMAQILNVLDASYGIMGRDEKCCGNSARRMGEEGLFMELRNENMKAIKKLGAEKILTTSPHCYNAFKNEYSDLEADIVHYTQYLHDRMDDIDFLGEFGHTVAYKDPCYLGRHNNVYEEPRELLKSIPELELIEMDRNRETALCCGGGGGRIWAETDPEQRFSNIGVEDALESGADILATACPYCTLNFEDSAKTLDIEDEIDIMDIAEILLSVI
ncbi:hypothetical protein AKJ62_03640 [candidate division MSBL1 archaeon SCGC-AAA259D14]|uniref:(Fe-S)-binding protein n=1 Tax=candidate division MSBL1 archaeon SCGC-AAA259D14 TaxID=1698261 RepID=A0A133U4R1_9EURY|nr:hypothetical protein AKJ62_03640 [candidate division MSBL1 archaeon SCGC-AAA259D14]